MKIQSSLLNTFINDSKFNFWHTALLFILGNGCGSLLFLFPAMAQSTTQINDHLPPPPPLSPRSRRITGNRITRGRSYDILPPAKMEPPTSNYIGREYTFSAPNASESATSVDNITGYRVEVLGNSDRLLEQVRSIEPKAFSKGDIIQVGIFSKQDNAANLVRQLALQGLWARIVSN